MKKIVFTFVFLLSCTFGIGAQESNPHKKQITRSEKEVIKLERLWLDAYENCDAVAMQRIVADDFAITYPNGEVQIKSQIIDFLKSHTDPSKPAPKYKTLEVESRAYGDIVILRGRLITEINRNGQIILERSRYTDVYHKLKGRWQVVTSHLSNDVEQ